MRYRALSPGDCLPKTVFQRADGTAFAATALGGQYLLICFTAPDKAEVTETLRKAPVLRDPSRARLVVVQARAPCPLRPAKTPVLDLFDPDLSASQSFGAIPWGATTTAHHRTLLGLYDPMLRLIGCVHLRAPQDCQVLLALLDAQPPIDSFAGRPLQAPVLYLPRVFSPELCADLIARHQAQMRDLTGVMRVVDGRTVALQDPGFKRRRDYLIKDQPLIDHIQARMRNSVLPELTKAFGFKATRMERYLVGCYDAHDAGHFAPHRDNTTPGTAHRRFAISINLNDNFEGGAVSFPEYGPQGFKAPAGTAIVFGCGLLHAVGRVTQGARYAFLPFVYDEAAASIRQANQGSLAPGNGKTAPQPGAV